MQLILKKRNFFIGQKNHECDPLGALLEICAQTVQAVLTFIPFQDMNS